MSRQRKVFSKKAASYERGFTPPEIPGAEDNMEFSSGPRRETDNGQDVIVRVNDELEEEYDRPSTPETIRMTPSSTPSSSYDPWSMGASPPPSSSSRATTTPPSKRSIDESLTPSPGEQTKTSMALARMRATKSNMTSSSSTGLGTKKMKSQKDLPVHTVFQYEVYEVSEV